MHRVDGSWCVEQEEICSYTASNLLATRTTSWYSEYVQKEIESYHYDHTGRTVSQRCDYFDGLTDTPRYSAFDTTAFDAQGRWTNTRSETWRDGRLNEGYDVSLVYGDTAAVWTYIRIERGDWINDTRLIYNEDVRNGRRICRYQDWNGNAWVDHELEVLTYTTDHYPLGDSRYSWENGMWAETERTTYIRGNSVTGRDTRRWNGTDWELIWQERSTSERMGEKVTQLYTSWNSGRIVSASQSTFYHGRDGSEWRADSTWIDGWLRLAATRSSDASGSVHASDSVWSAGALIQTSESRSDGSGHTLLSEIRSWNETDGSAWGRQETATYMPDGQESEMIRRTWEAGSWHPETRYLFSYDEASRIRSLKFFVGDHDHWVDPRDLSGREGSYPQWGIWIFEEADQMLGFSEFNGLTFTYRTGVNEVAATSGEKPEHSALAQNYPNPFNPMTTIPFAVAGGARTTIAIYDVLGREVARPVDEWKDPGEYHVQFDASALASGMYICRFTSGSMTQTRRMMLVR